MVKHTEEPWVVEWYDDWPRVRVGEKRYITIEGNSKDEAIANAYLVAASPMVFKEFKKLVASIRGRRTARMPRLEKAEALVFGVETLDGKRE